MADDQPDHASVDGVAGAGGDQLPMFLVTLPAGALADIVGKRRFLIGLTAVFSLGAIAGAHAQRPT